jgi:hypothetical protein
MPCISRPVALILAVGSAYRGNAATEARRSDPPDSRLISTLRHTFTSSMIPPANSRPSTVNQPHAEGRAPPEPYAPFRAPFRHQCRQQAWLYCTATIPVDKIVPIKSAKALPGRNSSLMASSTGTAQKSGGASGRPCRSSEKRRERVLALVRAVGSSMAMDRKGDRMSVPLLIRRFGLGVDASTMGL